MPVYVIRTTEQVRNLVIHNRYEEATEGLWEPTASIKIQNHSQPDQPAAGFNNLRWERLPKLQRW
jgi:hypothetical protein